MSKTYKELEQELAEIMSRVEQGSYDELDALLTDYKAGVKTLEAMQKQLDSAKNTIKRVTNKSTT